MFLCFLAGVIVLALWIIAIVWQSNSIMFFMFLILILYKFSEQYSLFEFFLLFIDFPFKLFTFWVQTFITFLWLRFWQSIVSWLTLCTRIQWHCTQSFSLSLSRNDQVQFQLIVKQFSQHLPAARQCVEATGTSNSLSWLAISPENESISPSAWCHLYLFTLHIYFFHSLLLDSHTCRFFPQIVLCRTSAVSSGKSALN